MTRRGFTILEVLIGLSLLIVLVAGAYGMLLQLHSRQQEIATLAARNTIGTTIIDSVERAMLTCVADGGADGAGVTVTDSTVRVVYREVSPDLPVSDGAFGGRARLAMIHHADRRTLEVTTTRGSRSSTTTIANIERVRFRAHDGEDWTSEFDSRAAKRLPSAVEVAVWFARPGGGTGIEKDAGESETREWREPDRLRVIAVFDSSADESIDAVAEEGDAGSGGII